MIWGRAEAGMLGLGSEASLTSLLLTSCSVAQFLICPCPLLAWGLETPVLLHVKQKAARPFCILESSTVLLESPKPRPHPQTIRPQFPGNEIRHQGFQSSTGLGPLTQSVETSTSFKIYHRCHLGWGLGGERKKRKNRWTNALINIWFLKKIMYTYTHCCYWS